MKVAAIDVEGRRYELRKMLPATGGYIWQKITAACYKAGQESSTPSGGAEPSEAAKAKAIADAAALPVEQRMRGACALAFMFMGYQDYEFAMTATMKASSRFTDDGLPMPLMADDGRWAGGTEDLQENPCLVTQVMTESLVFNLSPYLAARSATPRPAGTMGI